MKHIPERFSNLAFWRGVQKLRDEVVNAFEYVNSWVGEIEHKLDNLPTTELGDVASILCLSYQILSRTCISIWLRKMDNFRK